MSPSAPATLPLLKVSPRGATRLRSDLPCSLATRKFAHLRQITALPRKIPACPPPPLRRYRCSKFRPAAPPDSDRNYRALWPHANSRIFARSPPFRVRFLHVPLRPCDVTVAQSFAPRRHPT